MRNRLRVAAALVPLALLSLPVAAATFETPLAADALDAAAFAEWVDGAEKPVGPDRLREGPGWLVWTKTTQAGWSGLHFGEGKKTGPRHLRIGFKAPVAAGTVIARGESLSVLKPDAAYPGDLANDGQWIPARRLAGEAVTSAGRAEEYATWVLPPGTKTRALRFTRIPKASDEHYRGWVGGVWMLADRFDNVAPQAVASASAKDDAARMLVDLRSNDWGAWDNGEEGCGAVVSPERPEWVTLVWPAPRKLAGLCALWAGCGAVEAQVYAGPAGRHPREATEADWKNVAATPTDLFYPKPLGPNWLDFGAPVTTRAVRLRITKAFDDVRCHGHLTGKAKKGTRVWLGELMALEPLGDAPLAPPPAVRKDADHPPIPVPFTLPEPAFVTLVIDDAEGRRVRNLVSETRFPAGENTAWWDGLDDAGRDPQAAEHGVYHVPGRPVAPGTYAVRGLYRRAVDLRYEFSFYTNGSPAWRTADGSGEWLANHTPPQAAQFVPGALAKDGKPFVLLGSYVTEGGSGLAWVDLDGRKFRGVGWLGGVWTGAAFLCCDAGGRRNPKDAAYAASAWEGDLRLTALPVQGGDRAVLKWTFPNKADAEVSGIAARDGIVVCALPKMGALLFVDAVANRALGTVPLAGPRGIAFDGQGRLLALSGKRLVRLDLPAPPASPFPAGTIEPRVLVAAGLEDPQGICADPKGPVYVSDWGKSHQVKVFSADGAPVRVIGKPGAPGVGPYDPDHLNNPHGLTLDDRGRLWVTENNHQPKRVSVWTPDGRLDKAFYGPARYGCGGALDPADRTRLYVMGMELRLDWEKGTDRLVSVFHRPGGPELPVAGEFGPEDSVTLDGRQYLTNSFNANPTNATSVAGIWALKGGVARLVAVAGEVRHWPGVADCFGVLNRFSVRWTGQLVPKQTGPHTLYTVSDDGVRLWVDGKPLVDNWTDHGATEDKGTIDLVAGKKVDIRMEYYQGSGGATAKLLWSAPGLPKEAVPAAQLVPSGATAPGGLTGEYHNDVRLSDPRFTRVDPKIDFDFPDGAVALPDKGGQAEAIKGRLPAGVNPLRDPLLFAWSDRNLDGKVQADELSFLKAPGGGVTVQRDLAFITSTALRITPEGFTPEGVPLYDAAKAETLVPGGRTPQTSGGGGALLAKDGWLVLTVPPEPHPAQWSVSGSKGGRCLWTYPSPWNGLHPSHAAPVADRPGMLIGTTRLVGPTFAPKGSDAGELWSVNGNMGNLYVLTTDGLFVAELFKDVRTAPVWAMPAAERGMLVSDVSLHDENFWPTITQTADGAIHLLTNSCIVRVEGLETIRRLPGRPLALTADTLARAQAWQVEAEARRQAERGRGTLAVAIRAAAPAVDGALEDWADADWALIDSRITKEGDWGSRPDRVTAALAVSGDRLYAAFRANDARLLENSAETWQTLFKHGGCLDLMIGSDGKADAGRRDPVAGDVRLLVTRVKGKTAAVLYRPVVPGTAPADRVPFTSPVSTVNMDRVERVDESVQLAGKDGSWELSVPLALVGLKPQAGLSIRGDVGILRGRDFQTTQRCYWSNKATAITSDVPSEARLVPQLWGTWRFVAK